MSSSITYFIIYNNEYRSYLTLNPSCIFFFALLGFSLNSIKSIKELSPSRYLESLEIDSAV